MNKEEFEYLLDELHKKINGWPENFDKGISSNYVARYYKGIMLDTLRKLRKELDEI